MGTTRRSSSRSRSRSRSITTTPISQVEIDNDGDNHSIADLIRPHYENQTPLILKNYARDWPALSQWTNWDYLKRQVGEDWPCDVEMGTYNNSERLTIPFGSYVDYLLLYREQQERMEAKNEDSESTPILYLAQNDLPHGLYDDIVLPPFLNTNRDDISSTEKVNRSTMNGSFMLGQGKLYQCMWWMGPPRAESPLHFDPLDNILVQVVGQKHVVLLDRMIPREKLCAGAAYGQQENTSALPIRQWLRGETGSKNVSLNASAYLPFLQGTLEPSDALFIPAKWWHYIESPVDFTISVNVWWR